GEQEAEEAGADDRGPKDRELDVPEDLPFRRAEIGGGLDQAMVETGGEDEHDEEREGQGPDDMADQDRPEAELEAEEGAEKDEERRAHRHARHEQRQKREEDDAAGIAEKRDGAADEGRDHRADERRDQPDDEARDA